jgi:glycosyltransferase involved in cell wall biosynthesis
MDKQEKSPSYIPDDAEGLGEAGADEIASRNATENYFAPSTKAKYPCGVLYQGEFETPSDGTGQAVRLHARALAATGVPLLLRSFSSIVVSEGGVAEPVHIVGMPPEVAAEVGHLLNTDIAEFRPVIKHVVIRSAEHLRQILMPRGAIPLEAESVEAQVAMRDAIYGSTIVYSVWERDRIDAGIAKQLARVKQCWVPCNQNALLLTQSGVPADRVHVVPHPYTPDDPIHVCARRPTGMHKGWRRFYSIGRWEPRKGFAELIRAFLVAFKADDRVSLTIKYSGTGHWTGYPDPLAALNGAVTDAPPENGWNLARANERVKLISGRVKRSQIVKLHFENNIYVSSSHGEAWGLGSFDAKLAGNRLVYVSWGGVNDFATDDDIAVPCAMEPVHPSYKWEHGAQWAGYGLANLVEGLRRAQVPEKFELPAGFIEKFSMDSIGGRMKLLVDSVLS